MQDDQQEKKRWPTRAVETLWRHAGITVFVIVSAVMVIGWFVADIEGASPASAIVYPMIVGTFCGVFVVRKWTVLLLEFVISNIIGVISALQLFFGPVFHGQFRVAFLTMVFYAALGLIFGAVSELIVYLHRLSHDIAAKVPKIKK